MKTIKEFLQTTSAKRAMWTLLNSFMSLTVCFMAYLASNNTAWAIALLPIMQAFSQFITRELNKRY
jgi:hypothetical protein